MACKAFRVRCQSWTACRLLMDWRIGRKGSFNPWFLQNLGCHLNKLQYVYLVRSICWYFHSEPKLVQIWHPQWKMSLSVLLPVRTRSGPSQNMFKKRSKTVRYLFGKALFCCLFLSMFVTRKMRSWRGKPVLHKKKAFGQVNGFARQIPWFLGYQVVVYPHPIPISA